MTIRECYAALGGDYDEVIARLRSERLVQKFVLKFVEDQSYDLLCRSLQEGNGEDAFRAAHTIKGMCQNLGFGRLADSGSALTEALRRGETDVLPLFDRVREDYETTVSSIEAYKATVGI